SRVVTRVRRAGRSAGDLGDQERVLYGRDVIERRPAGRNGRLLEVVDEGIRLHVGEHASPRVRTDTGRRNSAARATAATTARAGAGAARRAGADAARPAGPARRARAR